MPDEMKPYRVVRIVGQEAFEVECCALMERGYKPAGGVTMLNVVHPITGQAGVGFVQAMYRTIPKTDLKIC